MIPKGLERLVVGGLVVELPADLRLPDIERAERYLRPFCARTEASPDVVIRSANGGRAGLEGTAVGEVPRVRSLSDGERRRRSEGRLVVTQTGRVVSVTGPLHDTLDLVAGIHVGLAYGLPNHAGLLLHASAVDAGGRAIVFPGPSEAGKTTAMKGFVDATPICDERCLVRKADGGWMVAGVPMAKDEYVCLRADSVRLAMLAFVVKNEPLAVHQVPVVSAIQRIVPAVVHRWSSPGVAARSMKVVVSLATDVACVELRYRLGEEFGRAVQGWVDRAGAGLPATRGAS